MLRIQRAQEGDAVTLLISGDLVGEYVVELERAVAVEGSGRRVILDLSELAHVTRAGVKLLAHLQTSGAHLVGCPEYVQQWVAREQLP